MKFKSCALLSMGHTHTKISYVQFLLNHADFQVEQIRVYIPTINSWGFTSRVGRTDFRLI